MSTRVAIVTGSARGIGRAIALKLAEDGLNIVISDLPNKSQESELVKAEIEKIGRKAVVINCDVTREEDVEKLVEDTVQHFGRLDVMVANAGIGQRYQEVVDADISEWERVWAVNIRGVIFSYKYAARQLIKQKSGGRIIGASSICGLKGYAGLGPYCISKFAVRSLTESTAKELFEHNITVNAYAPGVIETDMTRNPEKDGGEPSSSVKEIMRIQQSKIGQPEDIANLVSYLASPGARLVTGHTMAVDGGANF